MKLVVAIDSKESADVALAYMLKEKYAPGTEIHLVHAIIPGFADMPVQGIPDVVAEERTAEQKLLDPMAAELKSTLKATVSSEIIYGEVAQVVADVCRKNNADAVLVPSHARHGFSRLWFGSVADEIVDEAPCTVIVLKMPQGSKK
jgi:nucleotide-binding universal stress UspA family protein